jgi:hypothetical protein
MTRKDHDFIVDVVVIDPTRDTMASNLISQLTGVIVELNNIIKNPQV